MSAPVKLAAFAAVLALVFGAAVVAGDAVGPQPDREPAAHAADTHGGEAAHEEAAHPVRGLAVAENGLRLIVDTPELRRGAPERLTFRIVDEEGAVERDFDVEHTKRMHLIVARRDLTGFQHLHPEQRADGAWTVPVTVAEAGSYRLFADFAQDGEPYTLATDLRVDGAAALRDLPAPAATADTGDGYAVTLDGADAHAGAEADLRFTIAQDGRPVQVEPYLGAGGHLVALREGDLAFLHVHPTDEDGAAFAATFPTEGRYRLFLQFKHAGTVHTAAFTQEVH